MYIKNSLPWFKLIFLTLILKSVGAKMTVNLTQVQCRNYAPELLQNVSCSLNQTSRSVVSMEFVLTEDLKDLKGHYLLSVERKSVLTDYISMDMDYCQLLANQHKNYLIRALTNDVRRASNFPVECPFQKNKRYYIHEYSVDMGIIPSYMPEFNFITNVKVNYKQKLAVQFLLHGKTVRA